MLGIGTDPCRPHGTLTIVTQRESNPGTLQAETVRDGLVNALAHGKIFLFIPSGPKGCGKSLKLMIVAPV